MSDNLGERGKAVEDLFFKEKDRQLLEKLREEMHAKDPHAALSSASGIDDAAALEALATSGITPETLTSIALIPLVAVAWADNKMEGEERIAVMKAAEAAGIHAGSPSYETMESWLHVQPDADLLDAWKAYVGALKESLEGPALNQVKVSILGRAESVAKSAGGFLGFGEKVSEPEREVLAELEKAFD